MVISVIINFAFALLFIKKGIFWLIKAFGPTPRKLSDSAVVNNAALALGLVPPVAAVFFLWSSPHLLSLRKDSDLAAGIQWTLFASVAPLVYAMLLLAAAKALCKLDTVATWVLVRAYTGAVAAMPVLPLACISWFVISLGLRFVAP